MSFNIAFAGRRLARQNPVETTARWGWRSQTANLTSSARCWAAPPGRPEHSNSALPPRLQKMEVKYVKTRIAIGIVFVGALIYSMVTDDTYKTEAPTMSEMDENDRKQGVSAQSPMRLRMEAMVKAQQKSIVAALEQVDGGKFIIDDWSRPNGGGGGISCVLQDGTVFEKAGVNVSVVYGKLPRAAIREMRVNHKALDPTVESVDFFATGISMVLHPHNPMAPTVHLNYRYFETAHPDGTTDTWWFGGGCDLTPSYLFEEDASHFHQTVKASCDRHDKAYYRRFKRWCDDYFKNTHRGESRGIGGIFFDDLDGSEKGPEELLSFVTDCASAFLPSYLPILERRKNMPFTAEQKEWQQLRRGRYVEFNLVHDRGTSFGLKTPGARVESILMSLPLTARWQYMHEPVDGSDEQRLLQVLQQPVEWA